MKQKENLFEFQDIFLFLMLLILKQRDEENERKITSYCDLGWDELH